VIVTRKAKVVGRTDKKPQVATAVKLPIDVRRELSTIAADLDLTLGEVVVLAVDEYLGRRRKAAVARGMAKAKVKPKASPKKRK
jgi:hypothetical protein